MHWGVNHSPTLKKTPPHFCQDTPPPTLNLQAVQGPPLPFLGNSPHILAFRDPPLNQTFSEPT